MCESGDVPTEVEGKGLKCMAGPDSGGTNHGMTSFTSASAVAMAVVMVIASTLRLFR